MLLGRRGARTYVGKVILIVYPCSRESAAKAFCLAREISGAHAEDTRGGGWAERWKTGQHASALLSARIIRDANDLSRR